MTRTPKTLTLIQAAEFLQCNPETLRRLSQSQRIPCAKIGRKWAFIQQDLEQYIRNQYASSESVVQVVDNDEESLCQSISETTSGGQNSWRQTEQEYNALLGLKTDNKR